VPTHVQLAPLAMFAPGRDMAPFFRQLNDVVVNKAVAAYSRCEELRGDLDALCTHFAAVNLSATLGRDMRAFRDQYDSFVTQLLASVRRELPILRSSAAGDDASQGMSVSRAGGALCIHVQPSAHCTTS
jgi:hypothetical protein